MKGLNLMISFRVMIFMRFSVFLFSGFFASAGLWAELTPQAVTQRLARIEDTYREYYENNPLGAFKGDAETQAKAFKAWIDAQQSRLNMQAEVLGKEYEQLEEKRVELEVMDAQMAALGEQKLAQSVYRARYNKLLKERNELLEDYNTLVTRYNARTKDYQSRAERIQEQSLSRRGLIDELKENVEGQVEAYRDFMESGRERRFWQGLNAFYAELAEDIRTTGSARWRGEMQRLRTLRSEISEFVRIRQSYGDNKVYLVEVLLDGREPAQLVLDTGASYVTLSPALAKVLGWDKNVQDERRITLADGSRVTGPQIDAPRIKVAGKTALDVETLIIDEPDAGVDGLLGMSFLGRFIMSLDPRREQPLILQSLPRNLSP